MIEVYIKANCPKCVEVKHYLKNREIEFSEIELTQDNTESIIKKTGARVAPVVLIDGNYIMNNDILNGVVNL